MQLRLPLSSSLAAAVACAGLLLAAPATANTTHGFCLEDLNSVVCGHAGGDDDGLEDWFVDNVDIDHLSLQWFWIGVGDDPEVRVDDLGFVASKETDTNPGVDTRPDTLALRYASNAVQVDIRYRLRGSTVGSGTSDLAEQVSITNLTDAALAISFIEYTDFDLGGPNSAFDDKVEILDTHTVLQGDGTTFAEVVVLPDAAHGEVGTDGSILSQLDDGTATVLADVFGPLTGDAEWAFQWLLVLNPRETWVLGKDKQIRTFERFPPAPEPGGMLLLGTGLAGLLWAGRRRTR